MSCLLNKDSILADWSDEEEYLKIGEVYEGHAWAPKPAKVIELYERLSSSKVIELEWKVGERRKAEDDLSNQVQQVEQVPMTKGSEPEATDFDFEEENVPQLRRLGIGKSQSLKGGAKKKTTSLAGILSNMERHRIMDQKATATGDAMPRAVKTSATTPTTSINTTPSSTT